MKKTVLAVLLMLAIAAGIAACGETEPVVGPAPPTTTAHKSSTTTATTAETSTTTGAISTIIITATAEDRIWVLNSNEISEVLPFYQKVGGVNRETRFHNAMRLDGKIDATGTGVARIIGAISGVIGSVLQDNASDFDGFPGDYMKIRESDLVSAKAVSDGKITTITLIPKEQTDGLYGKSKEGPVGRTIGVLDGVQSALDALAKKNLIATVNGSITLRYTNPKVVIKLDASTGKVISADYSHRINIHATDVALKLLMPLGTVETLSGVIVYSVKLK